MTALFKGILHQSDTLRQLPVANIASQCSVKVLQSFIQTSDTLNKNRVTHRQYNNKSAALLRSLSEEIRNNPRDKLINKKLLFSYGEAQHCLLLSSWCFLARSSAIPRQKHSIQWAGSQNLRLVHYSSEAFFQHRWAVVNKSQHVCVHM